MKLLRSKHWLAFTLSLLSGPVLAAAATCTVTPVNSIITEGQTLQLQAVCDSDLANIDWEMDGVSVTGVVALAAHKASQPLYYTTPVGLGGSNTFAFTVTGTPTLTSGNTWGSSTTATVVVKPSSAVLAKAAGIATPTNPVAAACGIANGTPVTAMPTNSQQCDLTKGKPALAISGPTSFSWSCISLTGGAEANCSAVRGYPVTANVSGGNGTVSVANASVAAGGTTTVTATPVNSSYSVATMTPTGCSGTREGNVFTTGPINANCNVTATFSNAPVAGRCGSEDPSLTQGGQCAPGSTFQEAADTTGAFQWTCLGTGGGEPDSCVAPKQYTVTATPSGTGGTLNAPTSKTVTHNGSTTFTVTPDGTNVASAVGDNCTASVSGANVNVSAVTGACTVSVSFGPASQCGALPAGTTVYTAASPEPYVLAFDKLFDLATTSTVMQSSVKVNQTKAYEFTNDQAYTNGNVYTYYSTGPTDMSLSACPGNFDVPAECKAMAVMGPKVYWSKNGLPYIDPQYSFMNKATCNIGTGAPVYLNIRAGTTAASFQTNNTVLTK